MAYVYITNVDYFSQGHLNNSIVSNQSNVCTFNLQSVVIKNKWMGFILHQTKTVFKLRKIMAVPKFRWVSRNRLKAKTYPKTLIWTCLQVSYNTGIDFLNIKQMLIDAINFRHVKSKHPILDDVKVGNGTSELHVMIYFEIMFIIFLLNWV